MFGIDYSTLFVLALVILVFAAFIMERFPPDVVALSGLAALLAVGILDTSDFLGLFSNSAPITIACMFVLSGSLERTGVIDAMGKAVSRLARYSIATALTVVMLIVMIMSAFINNTPVVVVLTPVIISLARRFEIAPSRLLIPLSYAAIFGGTCTLLGTSTNLLVDGVASQHGIEPFSLFEIAVPGMILGLAGMIYMSIFGRHLLPDRETLGGLLESQPKRQFLAEAYIPEGSPLIGKTIEESNFSRSDDTRIIDVVRKDISLRRQINKITFEANDHLVFKSNAQAVLSLREDGEIILKIKDIDLKPVSTHQAVIVEGLVGPYSALANKRVRRLALRRLYGVYILAIHRHQKNISNKVDKIVLRLGDGLLLEGPAEGIKRLSLEQGLTNLNELQERPYQRRKAPLAIIAVMCVMALAAIKAMPIASLALIAAVGVVLTRCIDSDEVYNVIEWRILALIFGMLGLSLGMEKTGAASLLVDQIMKIASGTEPIVMLAILYFFTSVLTEMISNNAVAVLITPIAIGLAHQIGVDPRPFVVAVMFAASASFATPIGYQTNTFVYTAGGYKFTDFIKIGLPLNIIMWIVATLTIPYFWPF